MNKDNGGKAVPTNLPGITIKLDECDAIKCKKCEGEIFETVFRIVKIPVTHASPMAGRQLHVEEYMCKDCNEMTGIRKGM